MEARIRELENTAEQARQELYQERTRRQEMEHKLEQIREKMPEIRSIHRINTEWKQKEQAWFHERAALIQQLQSLQYALHQTQMAQSNQHSTHGRQAPHGRQPSSSPPPAWGQYQPPPGGYQPPPDASWMRTPMPSGAWSGQVPMYTNPAAPAAAPGLPEPSEFESAEFEALTDTSSRLEPVPDPWESRQKRQKPPAVRPSQPYSREEHDARFKKKK